jgi:hypothetical protein
MSQLIHLSGRTPVAKGRMRLVFEHPHDRSLLIKVIRPDVIERRWGAGAAWYKRRRRYGRYTSYLRELQEYIAAYAKHGQRLSFAQTITGLVITDMGLGLVVEAVRDEAGELAPSLAGLFLRNAFDKNAQAALEIFLEQIVNSDLLIADLNPGNMVYLNSPDGVGHFVLIDGLGVATILPIKTLLPWFNRRSKLSRVKRLRRYIATRG